jgi:hypothetical protein
MELGLVKLKIPVYEDRKKSYNYECNFLPLSQSELADDWIQKVPKYTKQNTLHHFSIKLTELPFNLWNKLCYDEENNFYSVRDGIYEYSIVKTDLDEDMHSLYKEIFSLNPNLTKVRELYNLLKENQFQGWLMLKAKKLIF